jgi:hypothetical protein
VTTDDEGSGERKIKITSGERRKQKEVEEG